MAIYKDFWERIIQKFIAEHPNYSTEIEAKYENTDLNSIGDRKFGGWSGSLELFATIIQRYTESQIFRDLRDTIRENNRFQQKLTGQLQIHVQHDRHVIIHYKPFSYELLMNRYRDYQDRTGMADELYKWERVKEFQDLWKRYKNNEIDFATFFNSINLANLVFNHTISVWNAIIKEQPEAFEQAILELYNEESPLQNRINAFRDACVNLHTNLKNHDLKSHAQEERAYSTLLTYRYPEKYTFYMDSFYSVLCKCLGKKPEAAWNKLTHYYEIVNEFREKVLPKYEDAIAVKNAATRDDQYYHDNNHLLLIQDIFYISFGKTQQKDEKQVEEVIDELVHLMRQFSIEEVKGYYDAFDKIKNQFNLKIDDKRLHFSSADNRLNFIVGQRYTLNLYRKEQREKEGVYTIISNTAFGKRSGIFDGLPTAYFNRLDSLQLKDDEWSNVMTAIDIELSRSNKSSYRAKNNNELEKMAFDLSFRNEVLALAFPESDINMSSKYALNTILFGPPGTGKTYHTIDLAVKIIDGETIDHTSAKKRFDELVEQEQVKFTTFHQSMSYEDFIEGIKPRTIDQQVIYEIEDGIFKEACAMAAYNCYKKFEERKLKNSAYTFDDLYDAFIAYLESEMNENRAPLFKSIKGSDIEVKEINRNDSIIARAKNSVAKSSAPLTKENIQKLYDRFFTIEEIKDLQQIKDTVQIVPRITEFFAVFRGLKEFERIFKPDKNLINESFSAESIDKSEILKKFNGGVYKEAIKKYSSEAKPIVLIIDEINRGNVSQIFGELITLIEKDKRMGAGNALSTTLPYSKMEFSVPPNLYIIGTMNTADRSVEALDTALRRRFSFVEMPPNYNLPELGTVIYHTTLSKILQTINKRIEKLLGKDNQIGHAYLMDVQEEDDLRRVFQDKIIPLLQEYFFGDYSKIGLVLGKGFIELNKNKADHTFFADFEHDSKSYLLERPTWEIKDLRLMSSEEFGGAIDLLLSNPKASPSEADH